MQIFLWNMIYISQCLTYCIEKSVWLFKKAKMVNYGVFISGTSPLFCYHNRYTNMAMETSLTIHQHTMHSPHWKADHTYLLIIHINLVIIIVNHQQKLIFRLNHRYYASKRGDFGTVGKL